MQLALANSAPIVAQLALGALALLVVAFAPPVEGRMLLVRIDGEPISVAAIESLRATPLKPGPLKGSWVVEGRRSALVGRFTSDGMIVLAAPEALCGGRESNEGYPV